MNFLEEIDQQYALGKSTKTFEVDACTINEIYEYGNVEVENLPLLPNQPTILKSESQSVLGITSQNGKYIEKLRKVKHFGTSAINKEQSFLQHVLDIPSIRCIVVTGRAGTGKSMVVSSYCLDAILEQESHSNIILSKPLEIVTGSRYWGTMPGGKDDKIEPFLKSFETCFEGIKGGARAVEFLKSGKKTKLEFVPVELMRGISIRSAIVYFDESQNLDAHAISTLGSRIDDRGNSKLILSGDLNQIDNRKINTRNEPGMLRMLRSKAFLESPLTAHVDLVENERGEVSNLFYEIFDKED